jgi:glycosyltransferase involved in cell wall biosynthesis
MTKVQVSIIIPMYNEERYIARCLESLTHQTFQEFEVILIDDGSTDKTVEIAQSFENQFPLTILQQAHG